MLEPVCAPVEVPDTEDTSCALPERESELVSSTDELEEFVVKQPVIKELPTDVEVPTVTVLADAITGIARARTDAERITRMFMYFNSKSY